MMPFGDQKWLVPESRIDSHSGLVDAFTFFAGTRPGPLRPGTIMAFAAAGAPNTSAASTADATTKINAAC